MTIMETRLATALAVAPESPGWRPPGRYHRRGHAKVLLACEDCRERPAEHYAPDRLCTRCWHRRRKSAARWARLGFVVPLGALRQAVWNRDVGPLAVAEVSRLLANLETGRLYLSRPRWRSR